MSTRYWIVVWREPAEATVHLSHADMLDTVSDFGTGGIDSDVREIIERGETVVCVLDRSRVDSACADRLAERRAEQKHRAQLQREHREAAL